MERVVPWTRMIVVIKSLYPTSGRMGRQPIGVPRMLRMYCLQQWYGLAGEAPEDALYDSQALRDFVGIDLSHESVPDATTLLRSSRKLLEREIVVGSLVIAKHLSELAMTRMALEAMTSRMTDGDGALASDAGAHQTTKSLLERAIAVVKQRPGMGAHDAQGPARQEPADAAQCPVPMARSQAKSFRLSIK